MTNCPGADALATIAGALEWDVEQGIKHLSSCEVCGEQLRALRAVRVAYDVREDVPASVVARIGDAIGAAAARERTRGKRTQSLGDIIEAVLAGLTALTLLSTGGMDVPVAVGAGVFGLVATSLFAYRVTRSSHATAVRSSSGSIQ
ncbi:MAG TPA: hypothetical protein VGC44_12860 [Longimicrobiales bacterium]